MQNTPEPTPALDNDFQRLPLLIRERQLLEEIVPWHRSTLWAKVKNGEFPKPIRLGPGSVAWRREDCAEWYRSLREAA